MLRITTSHSAEAAKNYFDVALKTSDYYTKDVGTWDGKGAEILRQPSKASSASVCDSSSGATSKRGSIPASIGRSCRRSPQKACIVPIRAIVGEGKGDLQEGSPDGAVDGAGADTDEQHSATT